MKEKRKPALPTVLAVSAAALVILALIVAVAILFVIPRHDEERGIDNWNAVKWSSFFRSDEKEIFLHSYPCADGDYYADFRSSWFRANGVSRAFLWLTFDDPDAYAAAKASRLHYAARNGKTPDRTEAFGFTVLSFDDLTSVTRKSTKKIDYQAFGYNDETLTLFFLLFDAYGKKEQPYLEAAKTDYPAFLDRYYGEWFDWEAGNRAPK